MRWAEQGTQQTDRYVVVPRALVFILHEGSVLLLRGAPNKRIWAGKLNGIGGHIEAGETVYQGAQRELLEEAGLVVADLRVRGIVHIAGQSQDPGVMMFALIGTAPSRRTLPSAEGLLEWHALAHLPLQELVEDLPELLPRLIEADRTDTLLFGHYDVGADGEMVFAFHEQASTLNRELTRGTQ